MFCTKCGSQNTADAAFCTNCGNKLKAPQAATSAIEMQVAPVAATEDTVATDTTTVTVNRSRAVIGVIAAFVIAASIVTASVITGGFGLTGIPIKGSVGDYSWEELSEISAEISQASDEAGAIDIAKKYKLCTSSGKLDNAQTKTIMLSNGVSINVQITGFWHDDKSDGSGKAGITFIFMDAIAEHQMNPYESNTGGWNESEMRSWLATDGMNMLPEDLRDIIVEVDKKTNNVGETDNLFSVSVTSDKLWLYSATELCGEVNWWLNSGSSRNDVLNAEGSEYKLYVDTNVDSSTLNSMLVKNFEGAPCGWWERSPYPGDSSGFYDVGRSGDAHEGNPASRLLGAVPGFCI